MNKMMVAVLIAMMAIANSWASTTSTQPMLISGTPGTYTVNTGSSEKIIGFIRLNVEPTSITLGNVARTMRKLLGEDGDFYLTSQAYNGRNVIAVALSGRPLLINSMKSFETAFNAGKTDLFGPGIDAIHYRPLYLSAEAMLILIQIELTVAGYAYVNPDLNSITVVDDPSFYPYLYAMLEWNDQPLPKAQVEVQVIEIRKDVGSQLGIYWDAWKRALPANASIHLTGARTAGDLQLNGFDAFMEDLSPEALGMFINYLKEHGVAQWNTQAKLDITHNKPATLRSGRNIPYSVKALDGKLACTGIAFDGIALDIKSILSEEVARLTVDAIASSVVGWTAEGQPITAESHLTIAAGGKYGENKVHCLSGLTMTKTVNERHGIPVLGNLPVLKYLFSYETNHEESFDVKIILIVK